MEAYSVRIVFTINTPAQAYFYKNIIKETHKLGHDVSILARDYGETRFLLSSFGLDHHIYSSPPKRKYMKIISTLIDTIRYYQYIQNIKPDLVIGGGVVDVTISKLTRTPCIGFYDGEPNINFFYSIQMKLIKFLVNVMITPSCYLECLGQKHIKINSFKELAYLHPDYYEPNDDILKTIGVKQGEEFAVIRLNAFDSVHDVGYKGLTSTYLADLISELEKMVKVFISTEKILPEAFHKYILNIPKNRIHDVIYYSKLFITETGTMTTEAAILGTPTILVHPKSRLFGNFIELHERYQMVYLFDQYDPLIKETALNIIKQTDIKAKYNEKSIKLINDKINMTEFMVWFIDNYPESINITKTKMFQK